MGEIAEMMLDGTLCEQCGSVLEDIVAGAESPGYPRLCWDCTREDHTCPRCKNENIKYNHKFCSVCGMKIEEEFFYGNK